MSSLGSTTSTYQFSDSQANVIGAPVGANMFGEIDQVFTRDNASTKAHYGTSTVDATSYDAANRQFFNDTMELGVDCGRVNTAAGRPDVAGGGCYPVSIQAQRASKEMDPSYNAYGPSAEQIVLAQGDILYAPSRFADQNNYSGPSISDDSFQPRLMGTRDVAPSGCSTSMIDQTVGNVSTCSLADDPLPYPSETDPRVGYGVDSPHTEFWTPIEDAGGMAMAGCEVMTGDDLAASMCNIESVQGGLAPQIPPAYTPPPGAGQARANVQRRRPTADIQRARQPVKRNKKGTRINPGVKMRMSPPRRR